MLRAYFSSAFIILHSAFCLLHCSSVFIRPICVHLCYLSPLLHYSSLKNRSGYLKLFDGLIESVGRATIDYQDPIGPF